MRDIERLLRNPRRRPPIPVEYAGKWVVWNKEGRKIIASGATLAEASAAAELTGERDYSFDKGSHPNVVFIGHV